MKKIKNKEGKIICLIAIFQILLFMCLTPAESYRLNEVYSFQEKELAITDYNPLDNIKDILGIGVNLLIGLLSIEQIGGVSAATIATACCPSTCSDVVSTYTECSEELIPTTCDQTSECKLGCCFDSTGGTCSTNSPKGKCEAEGGDWSSDKICSRSDCTKGCCIINNNAKFITEQTCTALSAANGVDKDFRQIKTELECLAITASAFEGACVLGNENCIFESEKECLSDKGTFYEGYLCSNPDLNTKCFKQNSIGCAEGKDEIYWLDSCGNRENIYDKDKDKSWNKGMVLAKKDSCGGSSGIIGSKTCGNCKNTASTCSETIATENHVEGGNFVCKDLGCKNAIANVGTQDRMNGEKWCLYDGAIGDGKSVVGSEHWLAYCHNGEVDVEMCGDYRTRICQQSIIEDASFNNGFSTASCVVNYATTCLEITQENFGKSELAEKCNEESHCMIKSINAGSNFQFSMCVPKYPKGDDLTDEREGNVCKQASLNCTMVFESAGFNNWNCISNCECDDATFAQQMSDLCMSIGDCGSNINILEKGTDNVRLLGYKGKILDSEGKETKDDSNFGASAPAIYSWANYIINAKAVSGQYVEVRDMTKDFAVAFGLKDFSGVKEDEAASNISNVLGTISGVAGGISGGILTGAALLKITLSAGFGGFLTVVGAAAAGIALGQWLGTTLNRNPNTVLALMILGGLAGAGVGIVVITWGVAGANAWNIFGWILAAVMAFIMFIIGISGAGARETRVVEFKCQAWNAPNGGDDCEKCNDNPLRPCTAYRCSSLGQLCEIINEYSESPKCISLPRESNPPIISAGEVKTKGYGFENEIPDGSVGSVEIIRTGGDEECINEYEAISFTLKTDEYAQCKYSFERPDIPTYESMEGYEPDEENLFAKNHTFSFRIPSIDNENVELTQETTDSNGAIIKYGELDMYMKCQDKQDPANYNIDVYQVKFCVRSGPDNTAVSFSEVIMNPENGAKLKFGAIEQEINFGINEPANCKYDTSRGVDYDNMQYNMTCKTGINDAKITGWPCTTKVENLVSGENKFYFRCKDMSGNVNEEDFTYSLSTSEKELTIDSVNLVYGSQKIDFGGVLRSGLEPISVNVKVKTSGGGYSGNSYCLWGVSAIGNRWMMNPYSNSATEHQQMITEMRGYHEIYIDCEDDAGNEASISGEFNVDVDTSSPIIIRMYQENDKLKIITNEPAKCYYSKKTCNFDLESTEATSMSTYYLKTHTATGGGKYYIKCTDLFGNTNINCAQEIISVA